MLFDTIDFDIIGAIFSALFAVLLALNIFVYPKKLLFNTKVLGNADRLIKENELSNGIARVFSVEDEKSSEFISKSVVMTKGVDCYLRAILAKELKSIAYEVTMYEEVEGEYLPFKTIIVKQNKIENGELDLVRLSERTKAVNVRVIMADGQRVGRYQVSKKAINKYSFISATTIIPAAIALAVFLVDMWSGDYSGWMVFWMSQRNGLADAGVFVLPILSYFAFVGISIAITRATFRPRIKLKGGKKNG